MTDDVAEPDKAVIENWIHEVQRSELHDAEFVKRVLHVVEQVLDHGIVCRCGECKCRCQQCNEMFRRVKDS